MFSSSTSIGEKINRVIEVLRSNRYEFFGVREIETSGKKPTINLPESIKGKQAIVIVLPEAANSERMRNVSQKDMR